jgi:hypothetical protein
VTAPSSPQLTLYYDESCLLCRNLALLVHKLSAGLVHIRPNSLPYSLAEPSSPRSQLAVRFQEDLFHDEKAWETLLIQVPLLKTLAWLPAKIFGQTVVVRLTMSSATRARRLFCRQC